MMTQINSSSLPKYCSTSAKPLEGNAMNKMLESSKFSRDFLFVLCLLLLFQCATPASLKIECKKYGHRQIIAERNCQPIMVQVNVCSGFCKAFSFFDIDIQKVVVLSKCCRMIESEWVNVTLKCDDGPRVVRLPSATECRCFDCSSES